MRLRRRMSLRRSAAKLLTKDETRRIAANIAKLPDLLRKECEGAMLETPILVVLIIAAIVAVLWWVYR
jgi:hypothetical protein